MNGSNNPSSFHQDDTSVASSTKRWGSGFPPSMEGVYTGAGSSHVNCSRSCSVLLLNIEPLLLSVVGPGFSLSAGRMWSLLRGRVQHRAQPLSRTTVTWCWQTDVTICCFLAASDPHVPGRSAEEEEEEEEEVLWPVDLQIPWKSLRGCVCEVCEVCVCGLSISVSPHYLLASCLKETLILFSIRNELFSDTSC